MKGQSSIEFLSLVSISMLLLAVLTTVMVSKQQETLDYQAGETSESVAGKVSFEVEMALVQGEGYSRVFTLPGTIQGSDYSVRIGNGSTRVFYSNSSYYTRSRYRGKEIQTEVSADERVFRVKHNDSGVFVVEE